MYSTDISRNFALKSICLIQMEKKLCLLSLEGHFHTYGLCALV